MSPENFLLLKAFVTCFLALSTVIALAWLCSPPRRGFHRRANWRAVYPDGSRSVPAEKATARDYAEIFGGTIERIPKSKIPK